MRHHGHVRRIEKSGAVLIELDSLSQCVRCRRGEGCGAVLFDPQRPGVTLRIEKSERQSSVAVESSPAIVMGQSVVVEIDDGGSAWLWPVFGAYGLPLLGMLLATGIATALTGSLAAYKGLATAEVLPEVGILLSAVLGLYGGILAWRKLSLGCLSGVLANAGHSLCLQSARIVAIDPSSE